MPNLGRGGLSQSSLKCLQVDSLTTPIMNSLYTKQGMMLAWILQPQTGLTLNCASHHTHMQNYSDVTWPRQK